MGERTLALFRGCMVLRTGARLKTYWWVLKVLLMPEAACDCAWSAVRKRRHRLFPKGSSWGESDVSCGAVGAAASKTFGDDEVKALKVSAMFELFRRTNRLKAAGFSRKIQSAEDVYIILLKAGGEEEEYSTRCAWYEASDHPWGTSVGRDSLMLVLSIPVKCSTLRSRWVHMLLSLVHNHPSGRRKLVQQILKLLSCFITPVISSGSVVLDPS